MPVRLKPDLKKMYAVKALHAELGMMNNDPRPTGKQAAYLALKARLFVSGGTHGKG